jgi:hypothetical protein
VPFAAAKWLGEALWLTLAVYGLAVLAQALRGASSTIRAQPICSTSPGLAPARPQCNSPHAPQIVNEKGLIIASG